MKTANIYQAERQIRKTQDTVFDKMEAIAYGVQARFEESTGYSRRITDATVNVARALGVADSDIERWAAHRLNRLSHDTQRLSEIKSLLDRLYENSPGAPTESAH
jgi:hypothetical protein